MNMLRRSLRRLRGQGQFFRPDPALEPIYGHLFARDLERIGEADTFCPTGGAANYSLLYLILRIGMDMRPASVLDIGAGQSSLLWDKLRRQGEVGNVLTLEHDPEWGRIIGEQVGHEILVTPLRPVRIGAVLTHSYDWDAVRERGPFEVMVCDGPIGTPHYSRAGLLCLLDERLPADFVLILDDAERAGEQDTVTLIHDRLKKLRIPYEASVCRAAKSQAVFAGGRFRTICHV